jgi:hypothetical protein
MSFDTRYLGMSFDTRSVVQHKVCCSTLCGSTPGMSFDTMSFATMSFDTMSFATMSFNKFEFGKLDFDVDSRWGASEWRWRCWRRCPSWSATARSSKSLPFEQNLVRSRVYVRMPNFKLYVECQNVDFLNLCILTSPTSGDVTMLPRISKVCAVSGTNKITPIDCVDLPTCWTGCQSVFL